MAAGDSELACGDIKRADPTDTKFKNAVRRRTKSGEGLAFVVGAVTVVGLTGLVGWLGYRAYESHQAEKQLEVFMQVGRQSALDLTTIKHNEVEADVQRILDLATGTFHDDLKQRLQPFVDEVRHEQSNIEGAINEAGLQTVTNDSARVLLAVSVRTTTAAVPEPHSNRFRMCIEVQRVGDTVKVSNVEFVP
ncbi:Mce protein [uncultured Mycobacterium sp.]|uniref:Mce protein n=1 Tax=uncultured Mycobacterium sp. TaxID=171292 RepID=UPI0035CC3911